MSYGHSCDPYICSMEEKKSHFEYFSKRRWKNIETSAYKLILCYAKFNCQSKNDQFDALGPKLTELRLFLWPHHMSDGKNAIFWHTYTHCGWTKPNLKKIPISIFIIFWILRVYILKFNRKKIFFKRRFCSWRHFQDGRHTTSRK